MPWLIEMWKRISGGKPFCLKGIQSVQDAEKAVELGCDGIVVSNHAGRQVDGAIASLDALENIVAAVGDKTYIMYDSGVRGAADVAKALAIGAKFVWVGRLWVWGLSIMGEAGVRHVMKSLLADFDILMNVGGFQNVGQIDRSILGESFFFLSFEFLVRRRRVGDRILMFSLTGKQNLTPKPTRSLQRSRSFRHGSVLPLSLDSCPSYISHS